MSNIPARELPQESRTAYLARALEGGTKEETEVSQNPELLEQKTNIDTYFQKLSSLTIPRYKRIQNYRLLIETVHSYIQTLSQKEEVPVRYIKTYNIFPYMMVSYGRGSDLLIEFQDPALQEFVTREDTAEEKDEEERIPGEKYQEYLDKATEYLLDPDLKEYQSTSQDRYEAIKVIKNKQLRESTNQYLQDSLRDYMKHLVRKMLPLRSTYQDQFFIEPDRGDLIEAVTQDAVEIINDNGVFTFVIIRRSTDDPFTVSINAWGHR